MDLGNNGGGFLLWMQTEKTDNQNGDWQIKPTIVIGSFPYIILGKKFPIIKSGRWLPSHISVKIPKNFLESTSLQRMSLKLPSITLTQLTPRRLQNITRRKHRNITPHCHLTTQQLILKLGNINRDRLIILFSHSLYLLYWLQFWLYLISSTEIQSLITHSCF